MFISYCFTTSTKARFLPKVSLKFNILHCLQMHLYRYFLLQILSLFTQYKSSTELISLFKASYHREMIVIVNAWFSSLLMCLCSVVVAGVYGEHISSHFNILSSVFKIFFACFYSLNSCPTTLTLWLPLSESLVRIHSSAENLAVQGLSDTIKTDHHPSSNTCVCIKKYMKGCCGILFSIILLA